MQITSGRVVDGRVELETVPEGMEVTVLARDSEETFHADAELKVVLLESIVQGQRGERISAEELLREMRSDRATPSRIHRAGCPARSRRRGIGGG